VTAPPKISVILAAGQPSSCRPTTDRGCKRPFKELPLTAESGGATRAALLAMRAQESERYSRALLNASMLVFHLPISRFLSYGITPRPMARRTPRPPP
jgi:hypothetical protein